MPPLAVPPSKPTKKSMTIRGRTMTEQKQHPHRRHSPNKSEKQKQRLNGNGNSKIIKSPRGIQSEDGSSCNSMGADDERESNSVDEDDDDDERTEESERSNMYTDNSSNSFVSLGYRNSHSKSTSFGLSQSTSSESTDSTSTSNEGEEEEEEEELRARKGSRKLSNRDRSDSTWFVSGTDTATSMSSLEGTHFKEKKSLKKLNTLAAKAKNETKGAEKYSALNVLAPTSSHATKGREKSNIHGTYSPSKKNTGSDSVASTDANSSKASISTAMFMKTMDEYTVKNAENQLLLSVKERGNVQKLSLQVR